MQDKVRSDNIRSFKSGQVMPGRTIWSRVWSGNAM